jgi:uncharacterized membrane protein YbhN (UPF0104 family)
MKEKIRKYRWIFQLLISGVLVINIYNKVDFKALIASFHVLPWYVVLIIPIIGLLQVFITTITQLKLFSIYSAEIGKARTFKENYVAAFYGMAVPGLIGSDLYLSHYFGKKINSYFNALTGILFLRIIGLIVFIVSITISFLFLNKSTYQLLSGFDLDINSSILYVLIALAVISILAIMSSGSILELYSKK